MEPHDIGAHIKLFSASAPADSAAATITGTTIDRATPGGTLYLSGVAHVQLGSASGTPDSFTVTSKLQHSDTTTSGDFVDVTGATGTTLTADASQTQFDFDCVGLKRYIRLILVVTFVNGTSPKIEVASTIALGGADHEPA